LIADEADDYLDIKVYTLSGQFTGTVFGSDIFSVEPEGLGLYEDGSRGFWVATDQHKKKSEFNIYDRQNFDYLGSFSGQEVANTDGICVTNEKFDLFPQGAVYAVHDDRAVMAFSWEDIVSRLGLTVH
jgi:3-phytase